MSARRAARHAPGPVRPLVKSHSLGQVTAVASRGISTDASERAGVRADGGAPVVISSSGKAGRRLKGAQIAFQIPELQ